MIANTELNSSTAIESVGQPYGESFATESRYAETVPRDGDRGTFQELTEFGRSNLKVKQLRPKPFATFPIDGDQLFAMSDQSGFVAPDIFRHVIIQKPYEMSQIVRDFIMRQKRQLDMNKSLDIVSTRISEFMKKQGIKAKILIDLETDTEYDDWAEPRIKVLVEPSEFERAYGLFDKLLNFSLQCVRRREMKRFRITLDAR
ncbi:MAG: hypothetical protein ABSB28_03945 [Candidatus Bathyarchaeia archaeon]